MPRWRSNNVESVQMPANPTRAQLELANEAIKQFHDYTWGIDNEGYHFFGPGGRIIRVYPGDWIVAFPDRRIEVYSPAQYAALFQ